MSRDGLLPSVLSKVHPKFKTPHIVTMVTGGLVLVAAAFFPVGQLADISNSGTLFAFLMVAIAVMMLRIKDPDRHRPFKTPLVWIIAPLAIVGCLVLFFYLPMKAKLLLPIWAAIGLVFYFAYGYRKSHVGRGVTEVAELDPNAPGTAIPPMPGAPAPGSKEERE
jgi:APA family basic amino acid/polyamine antiporter